MKRIFSGVQPSGNLHIGNYLGAIRNWVKLQDEFECIYSIVDMHAITVSQDPKELEKRTIEIAKILLASGIDPDKSMLFIQSQVHEHAELAWVLNTITKVPELERMTQYKEKVPSMYTYREVEQIAKKSNRDMNEIAKELGILEKKEALVVGLMNYPVLMAADILLYDTEKVPVGEDQFQHVELTRTLGGRFNSKFGETFKIPEPYTIKESARIMGLDNPQKKMAKSAGSEYNYIAITDDAEAIRKKIKKAVTDSGSEIKYQDDKPALKNLINIYSAFSDKDPKEIEKMYFGKGYAEFKDGLSEVIINALEPIQEKMKSLSDEDVLKILKDGAEKVRPLAKAKLEEVKKKIGFII